MGRVNGKHHSLRAADHYEYDCHVSSELSLVPFVAQFGIAKITREFVEFHQLLIFFFEERKLKIHHERCPLS